MYSVLSDCVLLIHFGLVAFVVGGFGVIWVGHFCGWRFVRRWSFRLVHLGVMAVIVFQAVTGLFCPLTTWENRLRKLAGYEGRYESSCIEYWVGRMVYYDIPPEMFRWIYIGFFVLLVMTMVVVKPGRKRDRPAGGGSATQGHEADGNGG